MQQFGNMQPTGRTFTCDIFLVADGVTNMKFLPSKLQIRYLDGFLVVIILTIFAGWLFTNYLGRVAEKEFRADVARDINLDSSYLHDHLHDAESAAKALSLSEAIIEALASGSSTDLEHANRRLDRIKSSMDLSVCYLLDRNGLTVASSNRNEPSSFVGKNFAFRPFFVGAVAGRLTTYFALGLISHERGYFAAAPVVDSNGTISGVIVIKKDIAAVVESFKNNTHAFLVSPDGIIFISSRAELLYRSLWPVDDKRQAKLLASRQFGNINFKPLLEAEPRTGMYVSIGNEKLYVQRLPVGSDGWSIVTMEDSEIVSNYRLFGILLTGAIVLLLLLFFSVLLNKNKSLEAARDLLKSKDDWKMTFDTVPDLIAIIDANYRITSMNRAMAERLGISKQEAIGRHCYDLLCGFQEPPSYCPRQRMLDSGKTESEILFDKNLNGDFIVTAAPILAEDGTVVSSVHVMHDITEMKRLGDEINVIHNLESIGLLAGGLAHDFNNVLNIIYGNITFAKMLADGNTKVVEPLMDAEEACERAKELGIRLQAFSQGNAPFKESIALAVFIEDAAATLFRGSNISHSISAATDVLSVEADPRQIKQVFENLLTNAKEAMSAGGTVRIDIDNYLSDSKKVLTLGAGRYVCIALQDDGKGIPVENLPKIFDPYFSTKDTYSQRGMGLGLSICHAVMKRHNGQISVESTAGTGTRVTLYLPASV
jgi:PAS domain S-box-containing protein